MDRTETLPVSPVSGVCKTTEREPIEALNAIRSEWKGKPLPIPTYTFYPASGKLEPSRSRDTGGDRYNKVDTLIGRSVNGHTSRDATGQAYKQKINRKRSILGDDTFGRATLDWAVMGTPVKSQAELSGLVAEHYRTIRVAIARKLTTNTARAIRGGDISAMVQDTLDRLLGIRWGDTGKGSFQGNKYLPVAQLPTDLLGERSRRLKTIRKGQTHTQPFAERFPNGKPLGSLVASATLATIREYSKHWRAERVRAVYGVGRTNAERMQQTRAKAANRTITQQRSLRLNPDPEQIAKLVRILGTREAGVLRMLAAGLTHEHIARSLNVSRPFISGLIKRRLEPMLAEIHTPEYVRNAS